MKDDQSFEVSVNTQLMESEALNLYAATGDWSVVRRYAHLTNIGASYELLMVAIALEIPPESLECLLKVIFKKISESGVRGSEAGTALREILNEIENKKPPQS